MGITEDRASDSTQEGSPDNEALANPAPRLCRYARGPTLERLTVGLESITPILGGATVPRQVDTVDFIRVPTLRGHLRFWWRALYAHECRTAAELALRERALWGGMGGDEGTRSRVELRVEVEPGSARVIDRDIRLEDPGAYALWTARSMKGEDKPPAPRWLPGLRFRLHVLAPVEVMPEVENALRAWVLWGGYGGRTRRGLGSLTVTTEPSRWLPASANASELRRLLPGTALFRSPPGDGARPVPLLRGARLFHAPPRPRGGAEQAWTLALGWLRDFRQEEEPSSGSPSGNDTRYAREPGGKKTLPAPRQGGHPSGRRDEGAGRPGRTRWPEPDKARLLLPNPKGTPWAHSPRAEYSKSKEAAWPRAGFGLPLAIRFQRHERPPRGQKFGREYPAGEPENVELRWHDGQDIRERLASPLIVKAMPLSTGGFAPIALWLCRAWPDGQVVLVRKGRLEVRGSRAPFDRLVAPGDTAAYAPLQGASTLRDAFFGWLSKYHPGVKESVE